MHGLFASWVKNKEKERSENKCAIWTWLCFKPGRLIGGISIVIKRLAKIDGSAQGCCSLHFLFVTSNGAYQQMYPVAAYVECLWKLLRINILQCIDFKTSSQEICPSVMNHAMDDHMPWLQKPCKRQLRRTAVYKVVNLQESLTCLLKQISSALFRQGVEPQQLGSAHDVGGPQVTTYGSL